MNIKVNTFKRCEIVLHSTKEYANPFMDVDVDAVFTHENGTVIAIPGFWNGGNEWKVRFASEIPGKWSYTVKCADDSLCDEGTVEVALGEAKTTLEKHGYVTEPKNGERYLTYGDGTPFFWLGDTHWQMADYERLHECNYPGCTCGNQFKHLADDRIKKGFNVYQTYFDSAESGGGGNKHVHHWWKDYYSVINPDAFNETMDVMIEYLADNGVTTAMGFGVHSSTLLKLKSAGFGDGNAIRAFAKYCVARYACYPVTWITAQEITVDPDLFAIWRTVGETVGKYDGFNRPNSAHMYPMYGDDTRAALLDNSSWHQHWTLQAGHCGFNGIKPRHFYESYYELASGKPYIEAECEYEDIYCGGFTGHDCSRIGAYNAVQNGSAGFTYGVTGVWAMGWDQKDEQGWLIYSPESWFTGMEKPGSTEMTYFKKYYEYVGWDKLKPDFGYEYGGFDMRKYVAISRKDNDILSFYFFYPDCETGMVFGLKPNVKYQARWYDPINGKFIDLPDVISADGKYLIPRKPSPRDWMLLLNDYDLGEYETEQWPKLSERPISRAEATPNEEYPIASIKGLNAKEDCEEGYPVANMIDGKEDTFWRPFAVATCQTFFIDLGKECDLKYMQILSKMADYQNVRFRVYGSNDNKNWDILSERPAMNLAIGGAYGDFFEPISGKYRYIKLFLNSTSSSAPKFEITKLGFWS